MPQYEDFWIQDVSAAMENLLLAARALGLGAAGSACTWWSASPAR